MLVNKLLSLDPKPPFYVLLYYAEDGTLVNYMSLLQAGLAVQWNSPLKTPLWPKLGSTLKQCCSVM